MFAASQTYWKMASKLKHTSFFGLECLRQDFLFLMYLQWWRLVFWQEYFLYEQTQWYSRWYEKKSYCLCNTSVLSDEINSVDKVFLRQTIHRHVVVTSSNFEGSLPTLRPQEMNALVQYSSDSRKHGFHAQSTLVVNQSLWRKRLHYSLWYLLFQKQSSIIGTNIESLASDWFRSIICCLRLLGNLVTCM